FPHLLFGVANDEFRELGRVWKLHERQLVPGVAHPLLISALLESDLGFSRFHAQVCLAAGVRLKFDATGILTVDVVCRLKLRIHTAATSLLRARAALAQNIASSSLVRASDFSRPSGTWSSTYRATSRRAVRTSLWTFARASSGAW